jgi:hypothetical protein
MAFAKVKDRLRKVLELVTEVIYEIEKDCDSIIRWFSIIDWIERVRALDRTKGVR